METSWYPRAPNVGVWLDWKREPLSHFICQLMLFPLTFLLLTLTRVPCLLTMTSTSLEGYLRKDSKGSCNCRVTVSLHTRGIKPILGKGTAAVVKNLQQDLVAFSFWQLKGRKVSVIILLRSNLPLIEALIEECCAPCLQAHLQIWPCGHVGLTLRCCPGDKLCVSLCLNQGEYVACLNEILRILPVMQTVILSCV